MLVDGRAVSAVIDGGVAGFGGNVTAVICDPVGSVGSNTSRVLLVLPVPEPSVQITARPVSSVSTPCGLAGRVTVCVTVPALEPNPLLESAITLNVELS